VLRGFFEQLSEEQRASIECVTADGARWILWKASHSQIKPIYELQKKIRRHYEAIINTARYHLSNARIEATNNKIKLTVRLAYGFRNIDNLLDMVMLRCSDISALLPYQRLIPAHTS
jgi:transposase